VSSRAAFFGSMRNAALVSIAFMVSVGCGGARPLAGKSAAPASGMEAAAPERPGLGTEWGETRTSRVGETSFSRGSPRPWSVLELSYNDAEGVGAQVAWRGGFELAPMTFRQDGVTVWLQDELGRVLPGVYAAGRPYVIGQQGQRYAVVVRNDTGVRHEAVVTVDGLDVVDGRPGDLGKRGYVIQPGETLVIDGFRRSWEEVAAFRFGRVADSYAARTSGDRNVGVIGVALFAEAPRSRWTDDELDRRETADPFPGGWR
jgi:hypothetical protein